MRKNIFIGVDGGGTKSTLVIHNEQGKVLAQASAGPASIRLSVDTAITSIMQALDKMLKSAGIDFHSSHYSFHLGAGLAGTEIKAACTEFLAKIPHFDTVCLNSDAYTACLGAHNGQDGAIIIVGTGVIGYKIQNGTEHRVSGWGFPHSDEGSGAWIGLELTRLCLHWLDGRLESTPLLEAIFREFNNDQSQLVSWANAATATEFATLAPLFVQYLDQKDANAVMLVEYGARAISDVAKVILQDTTGGLPLCLFGSLAPYIQPYLDNVVKERIVPRQLGALEGAILMTRDTLSHQALKTVNM